LGQPGVMQQDVFVIGGEAHIGLQAVRRDRRVWRTGLPEESGPA
jgi:hypothetical protein